nr:DNA repair protein REV1 [Leptinotarsa decemlineata]
MVREEIGQRKKKNKKTEDEEMGFGDWGGYMEAKRAKLLEQFRESEVKQVSNIFQGIAIHVNGLTKPPMNELKDLMAAHGGLFHGYQVSSTTHIIASNLPNVKIKHLGSVPIVKPAWITDSISMGKLLEYQRYLLYTNQSKTQPKIVFPVVEKHSSVEEVEAKVSSKFEENIVDSVKDVHKVQTLSSINTDMKQSMDMYENKEDKYKPVENICKIASHLDTNDVYMKEEVDISDESNILKNRSNQSNKLSVKTASDPKFLEEFYSNSRLHLISTLGAEFKQLVGEMRLKSNGQFPGKEKLLLTKGNATANSISDIIIMHIDMDCFFVSVGLRNNPDLRGKPVAITHARRGQLTNTRPEQEANRKQEFALYYDQLPLGAISRVDKLDTQSSMSEIASCSYEARKCGVKNGMFLGQAVKLCPNLNTLPYDFEGYKEVSNILYRTIASYTLDIEAVSCDEMFVDVTGILKETGLTVDEWATHIRQEIMSATGCPSSTGFGANRLQARLATRKAKPAGQYHLQPSNLEFYMSEIPLSDLPGVGRATLHKLKNLGLNTCGDVQETSLKVLQAEIGQRAGETLKEQSRGIDRKPLSFNHERKSVSAEINYGIRFKTLDECYNFLRSLSNEVYTRLYDIKKRARCLTLKLLIRSPEAPVETAKYLGHGICDSLTKTATNIIINSPEIVFKECKTLYEKLNPSIADLRGVGIHLSKLENITVQDTALSNFLKLSSNKNIVKPNRDIEKPNKDEIESRENETSTILKSKESSSNQEVRKSSRGRPRKNNNSSENKIVKPTSKPLTDFFGKTKNLEISEKSQKYVPVKGEIDLGVLSELPEELRKEIMKEYKLESTIPSTSKIEMETQKKPVKIRHKHSNKGQTQSRSHPFKNLTWDQFKPVIEKWTLSGENPRQVDVEMIANHFKKLALDRKIESLKITFSFLHRLFSVLNCNWHGAYFKIVNIMQEGMVARYGGTLMVRRKFQCCEMDLDSKNTHNGSTHTL